MSDDRKPVWPWIVALLIGLPLLYVASFGPACWLEDREVVPIGFVHTAYKPLVFVSARYCPGFVCDAATEYGMLCSGKDSRAALVILSERLEIFVGPCKAVSRESF